MRTFTFDTPDSSNIKSLTWKMPDSAIGKFIEHCVDSGTLTVEFVDGELYEYYDVIIHTVIDVAMSRSVGKAFNLFIRNDHRYKHIGTVSKV